LLNPVFSSLFLKQYSVLRQRQSSSAIPRYKNGFHIIKSAKLNKQFSKMADAADIEALESSSSTSFKIDLRFFKKIGLRYLEDFRDIQKNCDIRNLKKKISGKIFLEKPIRQKCLPSAAEIVKLKIVVYI